MGAYSSTQKEQEKLRSRVEEKDKTFVSPEEEAEERARDDEEARKEHMKMMLKTGQWMNPNPDHVVWMNSPIKKTKRDERLEKAKDEKKDAEFKKVKEQQEKLKKRVEEKDKTFVSQEEEEEERARDDEEARKTNMRHMLETGQWTNPNPDHVVWMDSPIKKTKRDERLEEEEIKAEREAIE